MSTLKKPLEEIVKKILEDASVTGVVSKEQLALVMLYQKECNQDKSIIKDFLGSSEMVLKFIDCIPVLLYRSNLGIIASISSDVPFVRLSR